MSAGQVVLAALVALVAGYAATLLALVRIHARRLMRDSLRRAGGANRFVLETQDGDAISPDLVYSSCVFDLRSGRPRRVQIPTFAGYWSLAFYSARGDLFHSESSTREHSPGPHVELVRARRSPRGSQAPRVRPPSRRGFVIARFFAGDRAELAVARRAATRLTCDEVES